jgi:ABC-type transporter Mla MlaB component
MSHESDNTTGLLLDTQGLLAMNPVSGFEIGADVLLEQAAILFAGRQMQGAEQLLKEVGQSAAAETEVRKAWWMLFDFYRATGRRKDFEALGSSYQTRFGSMPPVWIDSPKSKNAIASQRATPTISLVGKLDLTVRDAIERALKLCGNQQALRFEFMRITDVTAEGCMVLTKALRTLQKSGYELTLLGAAHLVAKLRARVALEKHRREDACWSLMFELLQLLNLEQEFEQAGLEYCVLFEVSPPAFMASEGKVAIQALEGCTETVHMPVEEPGFKPPSVIEGPIDILFNQLLAETKKSNPLIVDCTHLSRVEFNAAIRLATALGPACNAGKKIEFRQVSHLVATLLQLTGFSQIVPVHIRNY